METKKTHQTGHTEREQVDAIQAARDYGIDVTILLDNLKRTPAERIRRHQIALETVEKLQKTRPV